MRWFATLLLNHRLIATAVLFAVSLFAIAGITRLAFDDDPRNIIKTRESDYADMERLFADFGADDRACIVVVEADDVFTPPILAAVGRIVQAASQIEGLAAVRSVFDMRRPGPGRTQLPLVPKLSASSDAFAKARERALAHPLVAGQLLSADARTMLILVELEGIDPEFSRIGRVAGDLRDILAAEAAPGASWRLTGLPLIRFEIRQRIEWETLLFNAAGALLGGLIAIVMFRSASAVVLVMAAPMLGSLWTAGAMGWAGISLNVINSVVPVLVLIIGLTDSVHFLVDIRRSRVHGLKRKEAISHAMRHAGIASGLTSLTTAIGFASLLVADVDVIRDFGLICAIGSILTFTAVAVAVPLLASTRIGDLAAVGNSSIAQFCGDWSNRIVAASMHRPFTITAIGIAIMAILTVVSLRLSPDTWISENLPNDAESAAALARCDQAFGGIGFVHVVVQSPPNEFLGSPAMLAALADIHEVLDSRPPVRNSISLLNLLSSLPEARRGLARAVRYLDRVPADLLGKFVNPTNRQLLVSAHLPDVGAAALNPVFSDLSRRIASVESKHPRFPMHLAGSYAVACRNIPRVINDLGNSIGLEAVVIFGLMGWSFRSLGLGMISVLPNVIPLVCVASLIVLLGWPLQIGSVIVFNICLGLAVDDTIHVMTRFRRLSRHEDPYIAVRKSFAAVGPAILTTTAILIAGFGIVTLSDIPALRLFGALSCTTIVAALVAELILLPAMLAAFLRLRGPRLRHTPKSMVPRSLSPLLQRPPKRGRSREQAR